MREPMKEKSEPIILDYVEQNKGAKEDSTWVLKIDWVLFGEDKEPSVKLSYLLVKEDKVSFDTSIVVSEGEFIAL